MDEAGSDEGGLSWRRGVCLTTGVGRVWGAGLSKGETDLDGDADALEQERVSLGSDRDLEAEEALVFEADDASGLVSSGDACRGRPGSASSPSKGLLCLRLKS